MIYKFLFFREELSVKYLIFGGSGAIGRAVAWDLASDPHVERVGIVGRKRELLKRTKEWIDSSVIVPHVLDVLNPVETKKLMEKYDVGIVALPNRKASYRLINTAIEAGFDTVDILEEYHRCPDAYETEGIEIPKGMTLKNYGNWLHDQACQKGVTILDGMGFAPGLSNITVGEGIRKLDRADSAIARVGGIPSKEAAKNHPLGYMITWAFEHVLREYMVKLNVLKERRIAEVEAMSGLERFRFTKFDKDEELECAITPGMPSFIHTRPKLKEFAEKTIRWPGHWEGIKTLKDIGLLEIDPVEFQGVKISPREFMLFLLKPKLRPNQGETDICVMWNSVAGTENGVPKRVDFYLWDEADAEKGLSAMARVTGFSEAIGARFLARGEIRKKGIVAPEDGITGELYPRYIAALKERGIVVLEEINLCE
jgi:lysine 6-dehydrogenase